jgi:hypothetical protein
VGVIRSIGGDRVQSSIAQSLGGQQALQFTPDKPVLPDSNSAFYLYFGWSWLELDKVSFSRTQFGTHLGYFADISGVFPGGLNLRKCLWDAGFELVPGGGIEPSTHGFSGRIMDTDYQAQSITIKTFSMI